MKEQPKNNAKWRQTGFFDNRYTLYKNEVRWGDIVFAGFEKGVFTIEEKHLELQKEYKQFILKQANSTIAFVEQKGKNIKALIQKSKQTLTVSLNKKGITTCQIDGEKGVIQIFNPDPRNNGWASIQVKGDIDQELLDISIFIGLFFKRKIMLFRAYFFGIAMAIVLIVFILSYFWL